MQHVEQVSTGDSPPAAMPLDYAGPMPQRPSLWLGRVLKTVAVLALLLLAAVILMPSTNGHRNSDRVACMANLLSVGQAIQLYSNAHGGRLPDTVEQAIVDGWIPDVRILICPTSTDTPAQGATHWARAANLTAGGHLSYVYVGAGLTSKADGDTVLAYEHAGHHKGKGGNVLFADGHVQWLNNAELRSVIDWYAAGNGPMVWGKSPKPAEPATRAAMRPAERVAP